MARRSFGPGTAPSGGPARWRRTTSATRPADPAAALTVSDSEAPRAWREPMQIQHAEVDYPPLQRQREQGTGGGPFRDRRRDAAATAAANTGHRATSRFPGCPARPELAGRRRGLLAGTLVQGELQVLQQLRRLMGPARVCRPGLESQGDRGAVDVQPGHAGLTDPGGDDPIVRFVPGDRRQRLRDRTQFGHRLLPHPRATAQAHPRQHIPVTLHEGAERRGVRIERRPKKRLTVLGTREECSAMGTTTS